MILVKQDQVIKQEKCDMLQIFVATFMKFSDLTKDHVVYVYGWILVKYLIEVKSYSK